MNCVYIGVYVKVLIRFLPFLWIFFSLRGRIENGSFQTDCCCVLQPVPDILCTSDDKKCFKMSM